MREKGGGVPRRHEPREDVGCGMLCSERGDPEGALGPATIGEHASSWSLLIRSTVVVDELDGQGEVVGANRLYDTMRVYGLGNASCIDQ